MNSVHGIPDCDDLETIIAESNAQLRTPAAIKGQIFAEINKKLDGLVSRDLNNEIIVSKEKYVTLLNAKISELSSTSGSATLQPISLVSSILDVNQPSDYKANTNGTPSDNQMISKWTYAAKKIQEELQTVAVDGLNRLQLHKSQQMAELQQYYDSLTDSSIGQMFIEGQQNICTERSAELWIDVAVIDHQMASVLRDNQLNVVNYFQLEDLRTKIEDVESKIESLPEFKELAENPSHLDAWKTFVIESTCNLYSNDLAELIQHIKEIDGSLTSRLRKVENIPTDLARSWNLMRVDLDSIFGKLFTLDSCKLLGLDVFGTHADKLNYTSLATEIYAKILTDVHSDVEEGIRKMHLVNFVLTQMNN